ncbi:unnamed protein product [Ilex paraguariensis]|uniref:Uncharacterized protein n=1 Tax=Ilex paraguariensis TaxID=185542 RepID=A0ABC8R4H1_9AQUA
MTFFNYFAESIQKIWLQPALHFARLSASSHSHSSVVASTTLSHQNSLPQIWLFFTRLSHQSLPALSHHRRSLFVANKGQTQRVQRWGRRNSTPIASQTLPSNQRRRGRSSAIQHICLKFSLNKPHCSINQAVS